jgi:maltose O-acetyltransferase
VTGRRSPLERIARIPGLLRGRFVFRSGQAGPRVHVAGRVLVRNRGVLRIGDRCFFLSGIIPTELVCERDAELLIGAGTGFNYGASIRAGRSVRIGERCLIASMVRIRDDDGFQTAPVRIGDDVWISHGALVEPGVTIGNGAVVAAGSVVTSDVPEKMMALGNPARIMPLKLGSGGRQLTATGR